MLTSSVVISLTAPSPSFALTEIAKNNAQNQKQLLPLFKDIIKTEQNNGVKNVYIKAIKIIEKMN